jgi:hypothetical protein
LVRNGFTGVNEVRFRNGRIMREGLKTTLSDMRLAKSHRSARLRWEAQIQNPSVFVCSRERAKLGYFWRHSYRVAESGPFLGSVVNPDTGRPVLAGEDQFRRADFRKIKHAETVTAEALNSRRTFFSALWQADRERIQRMAPIEFIGRYLNGFFDYAIADEVHELKGETAQGNALGIIASACERTVILTGTLLGGYADELFNILYRLDARMMREEGFDHGEGGVRQFAEAYGVLEKVTTIEPFGECLFEGEDFHHGKTPAGRIAAAVRQVPYESGGVRIARRYFGRVASVPRGSPVGRDGPGT